MANPEGFLWPDPASPGTATELLAAINQAYRVPANSSADNMTGVNKDGFLEFYAFLFSALNAEKARAATEMAAVAAARDAAVREEAAWRDRYDDFRHLSRQANAAPAGTGHDAGTVSAKAHLKKHEPPLFVGEQKLEAVRLFLSKIEHWVRVGGSGLPVTANQDDKLIYAAWRFMDAEVFAWFETWWKAIVGNDQVIPPTNGRYGTTWENFKTAFQLRYVSAIAVTVVRREIAEMKFKRGDDIVRFNRRFAELIRMLGRDTTVTRAEPLYDAYLEKFPEPIRNQVVASARMQRKLTPNTPFTLADAMELAAESYAEAAGSGVAVAHAATHHGPPAARYDPDGPQPMDISLTHATPVTCYRCRGTGHVAKDCASPDTRNREGDWRRARQGEGDRRDGGYRDGRRGERRGGRGGETTVGKEKRSGGTPHRINVAEEKEGEGGLSSASESEEEEEPVHSEDEASKGRW